jgi:hypothetical protein
MQVASNSGSLLISVLKSRPRKTGRVEEAMAKKQTSQGAGKPPVQVDPMVAAQLTGIIYQARLFNRQARMNVPEQEVVSEVVSLWRNVMAALADGSK